MRKNQILILCSLLLLVGILAVIYFGRGSARYVSEFNGDGTIKIAMPIISSRTVELEQLYPDSEPKRYELQVMNYNETQTSDVMQKYTISIENIGNIPLDIKLYHKEDGNIVGGNILTNGVSEEAVMAFDEEVHTYELEVQWDKNVDDYNDYKYSGETSCIEIKIDALEI